MTEIVITGTLTTSDPSDIYATHDSLLGKGGIRTVIDYTERNAISLERREVGMLVYVSSTNEYWKLLAISPWGYDDFDWELFTVGGSSSGIKNHLVPSDNITVDVDFQYLVYGNLTIEGVLTNNGQVVIINGGLVLVGLGQFINNGSLLIVDLQTGNENRYSANFTTIANIPLIVTHNLSTEDFVFTTRSGGTIIDVTLNIIDSNTISITTTSSISGRINIIGVN